ncbi:MAG: SRPBCC family protein [Flavobacteriales bacterium]|nr:SRPBCC family protein [Flavobacteriales bacterium]
MKILKYLIILLVFLAGVWLVMCAIAPSSLELERSVSINTSSSVVYSQVSCLDQWPNWSPWAEMDPEMKNTYSDDPCGKNASVSWTGEKAGAGTQTIVEATANSYLKTSLEFDDRGLNYSEWNLSEADGATTVTWNFLGAETPFMMRGMNLVMKGFLEEAYENGLAKLKKVCEAAPAVESVYDVLEIEQPEIKYLLVSGDVKPENIGDFYGENFGKIMGYMAKNGIELNGHPGGLIYSWTDTLAKMSAAVPIKTDAEGTKEIEFRVVEGGRALQIDYYGAYEKSGLAHMEMDSYMEANSLEMNGTVVEVYVTDPTAETDTSKWLTQVIYPVKSKE